MQKPVQIKTRQAGRIIITTGPHAHWTDFETMAFRVLPSGKIDWHETAEAHAYNYDDAVANHMRIAGQ